MTVILTFIEIDVKSSAQPSQQAWLLSNTYSLNKFRIEGHYIMTHS